MSAEALHAQVPFPLPFFASAPSIVRRPLVQGHGLGLLLAQALQLASQQVDLLLLARHHGVELFDLVFEETGLDFQLGEAVLVAHRGSLGGLNRMVA